MLINNTVFLVTMTLLLILFIIITIVFILMIKSLIKYINDLLNISYIIKRKIDITFDEEYRSSKYVQSIDNKLSSLSNRIGTIISEQSETTYRMPSPDEITAIQNAIRDQVLIEFTLSEKQRVPRASLSNAIINVCNTFPNIDPEYIVKKTIAIVESWNS